MTERPTRSLAEAGVAVLDCEHKTPTAQSAGHPYIAIPDIQEGRVVLETTRRISDVDLETWTRRTTPSAGDVVVTRRGRVGDSAPIPPGVRCAIGQNLVILRSDGEKVDQAYLRWAARSPAWWSEVDRLRNVGAVFSSLNVGDIGKVRLPFPRLSEQRAIAEVLGALDDKIAANTRLATTADALARMDFARALGLPGVEEIAVGQCATTVLGGTPSRDEFSYWTDGTVGWLNSGKANEARILQPSEWITEEALSKSAAKVMPQRATVVAITGATLGQVARLEITASGNQSLIGIWSDDPALNDWIYFAIQHEIPQLLRAATGAAQQHVNKRDLDALVLPILDGVDLATWGERVRPLLDLAAARERENLTLAATRDALLPALMSGQFRVRDAEPVAEEVV